MQETLLIQSIGYSIYRLYMLSSCDMLKACHVNTIHRIIVALINFYK